MEENVRKELETLKGMVLNWKKSYVNSAAEGGGGDFLAQDLSEEIDTIVYPYVCRMYECNYIDGGHVKEIMDFCHQQVQELRDAIREEG
ncbi:hypothetical protein MYX64_09205 [Nitrospinae bacterium AH_259_B05_G02_I21]|nr:hypothetical protein [Nitrospinae bacterium AH_259_B05_G02_I21]MDA2932025.1 hypothetical protein [Nitrospinae bacterium AH-259-F20]